MSGGSNIRVPIYVGPPIGMYEPQRMGDFVVQEIVPWMRSNEIPSDLNIEGKGKNQIYNFPNAQLGIDYYLSDKDCSVVQLMCTPRGKDTLDGLFRFIMRRVRETKMGLQ